MNTQTPFVSRLGTCTFVVCLIALTLAGQSIAQQPYGRHSLIRGDMPPGLAADAYRLANPQALTYHVQPVRVIAPNGSQVHIGGNGGYIGTHSSRASVGLSVGPVYRMKITGIPRHFDKELFPSIELLDKLNPPTGLENEFPVQIVITQDDLEQALEGRMVTKVIYLENPETALPHRHKEDHQPYFDVGGGEDPLRAAERLGRPMAILRIGSRVPTNDATDLGFGFHTPAPAILPDPQQIEFIHNPVRKPIEEVQPLKIPGRSFLGDPSRRSAPLDWQQVEQLDRQRRQTR